MSKRWEVSAGNRPPALMRQPTITNHTQKTNEQITNHHEKNDYFHIASGYYIYECLPCDYNEMTNDELEDFLAEVAWEPFQFYSGNEILQAINDLADRFEMIAKDAREKAIDSVIELLKSKAIDNNQ
jgi:hypothetical protein